MGAADVVPGVSGGMMALIVGIYERLISSVREGLAAPVYALTGNWDRTKQALRDVDWALVIPLAAGIRRRSSSRLGSSRTCWNATPRNRAGCSSGSSWRPSRSRGRP